MCTTTTRKWRNNRDVVGVHPFCPLPSGDLKTTFCPPVGLVFQTGDEGEVVGCDVCLSCKDVYDYYEEMEE